MIPVIFVLLTLQTAIARGQNMPRGQFRAAVYEHQLQLPYPCLQMVCSRQQAIQLMENNLIVLRTKVEEAASQGASIILLPEDAIHGYGFTRKTLLPFLELAPAGADGSNPCFEDNYEDNYVQMQLSCLAAENNIYVAATLGTRRDGCSHCGEENCYYNTLVVYSNTGNLVGLYHKYNLWTSELSVYDIDPEPALVTVDTPFGRLGLAICADLLWKSPVVDLVEQEQVDTLLLPLAWWDLFPHQLAHAAEDSWARGLQVNLLAANLQESVGWSSGSGLFGPKGALKYRHDLEVGAGGSLLIADLDIKPTRNSVDWPAHALDAQDEYQETEGRFKQVVYDDLFTFVPLLSGMTQAKVCTDDQEFCCLADFQADLTGPDQFSLGVFSGDHYKDGSVLGHYRMQMCSIMKCDPASPSATCNQDLSWDYDFLSKSSTTFHKLNMSASFAQTAWVYPEVLFDKVRLEPNLVVVSEDGVLGLKGEQDEMLPLVSMSLFGRWYEQDPGTPYDHCPE